jgi:TrpR family transcriptional regulator, trp operon repressor
MVKKLLKKVILYIDRFMKINKLDELALVLSKQSKPEVIEQFLKSLLTPREIADISKRWELVKLLDGGMTQRAIASKLKISLCKITRGSKELKKGNSIFKKMIDNFYHLRKQS